jgi:uncharacterized glyoxalase superfamily protein PhnB
VKSNRSAPEATVVPVLVYEDPGKALDWLCSVFGFTERLRVERAGIVMHAQLIVGDAAIMLGRQGAEYRAPRRGEVSQYVHVTVSDVNAHHDQARQSGAHIVQGVDDKPFGERQYSVEDLEGHRWTFSQHVADVPPEAWGARVART